MFNWIFDSIDLKSFHNTIVSYQFIYISSIFQTAWFDQWARLYHFVNRRSTLYLHVPHVQGGGRGLQGQEKLAALVFILLCFPFASLPFLQQPNNTRKLHEYQKYTSTCVSIQNLIHISC